MNTWVHKFKFYSRHQNVTGTLRFPYLPGPRARYWLIVNLDIGILKHISTSNMKDNLTRCKMKLYNGNGFVDYYIIDMKMIQNVLSFIFS